MTYKYLLLLLLGVSCMPSPSNNTPKSRLDCSDISPDSLFYHNTTKKKTKMSYRSFSQFLEYSAFSTIIDSDLNYFFKEKIVDITRVKINFNIPDPNNTYDKLFKINTDALQNIDLEIILCTNMNTDSKFFKCGLSELNLPDTLGNNCDFLQIKKIPCANNCQDIHVFNGFTYSVIDNFFLLKNARGDHIIILTLYSPGSSGSMLSYSSICVFDVTQHKIMYCDDL
jgi:hypothetical protein